jgi:hypothetical protein
VKQKGILSDFIWGPAPKPPGFNALWTKACRAGWHLPALPHASVTDHGARGASQRCPILRVGGVTISLQEKISRQHYHKKKRVGNFNRKWAVFFVKRNTLFYSVLLTSLLELA